MDTFSTMNSEIVCRVCLIINVKMYDLKTYPLELYFEPFILSNPLSIFDLPNMVCYQCASLMKKFYLFKEKCIKAQTVLYGIMDSSGSLNASAIKKIDRKQLKLASDLDIYTEPSENIIQYSHKYDSETPQSPLNGDLQEMCYEVKTEVIDDLKFEENDLFDYPFQMSSSDDEPLSKHKSQKKKKKKLERLKEKMGVADVCLDNAVENTESVSTVTVSPTKTHKGRGRPKKISKELTDIAKELDELNNISEHLSPPKLKTRGRPRKEISTKPVVKSKIFDEFDNVEEYAIAIRLTPEEQLEEVTKRQTSSNYMNSQYKCDICYKGYMNTDTWQHHMDKHHPSAGDAECAVCHFRFKSQRILKKHENIHAMKFQCKSCSVVCKTKTQAKQHQRWHKGVTYTCQYCDEEFSKWTSYLSHVRIKHPSAHICPLCGYSFVSAFGLAMHRSMMHKDEEGVEKNGDKSDPLFCSLCDVQFTTDDAFRRHLVTSTKHSSDRTFSTGCKECGERFPDTESLRLHHRKEHARKRPANYGKRRASNKWPSKCMHCDESVENARDYWAHFRRVHPDLPYPVDKGYICEICGKGFRGNAFLKYHKRTHFSERAYQCPVCPKSFYNRTNLQMHSKIHSEARPYPCNVCFKAFKSKGALDRHFRSHTGAKPYQCELCGKAFNQSNSRKLHVRTVHLKQPAPYVSKSRMERRKVQTKLEPGTNYSVLGI